MSFLGIDALPNPFEAIGNGFNNFINDVTGVTASEMAVDAANDATQLGIDEERRQFDAMQAGLAPYTQAGEQSLQAQQALSGALGPEAQAAAYAQIQNSAGFQSQLAAGENSILQNASATGGLRGGNTQAAMAQFSPQLLSSAIDQRYNQLGGITQIGQASAAGVGSAGMNMGQSISDGYGQIGSNTAAGYMNQYSLPKDLLFDTAGLGLQIAGLF